MTATTALTAQNTQGVIDIHVTPSTFVVKQIDACIDDIGADVVKTGSPLWTDCLGKALPEKNSSNTCKGMLASAETVTMVAAALRRHKISLSVIDPVSRSPSYYLLERSNSK